MSMASSKGVNLKSGKYLRSFALFAVFLNCPSACFNDILLIFRDYSKERVSHLCGIEFNFSFKVESFGDRSRNVSDTHFILLSNYDGKHIQSVRQYVENTIGVLK